MCDSRRPLNGADSADWDSHTAECLANGYGRDYGCTCPERPVWPSRAVNGGWDTSAAARAENGAQSLLAPSTLRLVA